MANSNHDEKGKFSSSNVMRAHEYEVLKAHRYHLEQAAKGASQRLKEYPGANSGPAGLTPDHIKKSDGFRSAKADYEGHFSKLKQVNEHLNKNFSKELKADRKFK